MRVLLFPCKNKTFYLICIAFIDFFWGRVNKIFVFLASHSQYYYKALQKNGIKKKYVIQPPKLSILYR